MSLTSMAVEQLMRWQFHVDSPPNLTEAILPEEIMSAELTKEAWDAELLAYKSRHRLPDHLTDEQAQKHFASLVTSALKSLVSRYANHVRKKNKQAPVHIRVPDVITTWISEKVSAVDDFSGHFGSRTYQSIANELLGELRDFEDHFRNS